MDKAARAGYLASLLTILEHQDKTATMLRSRWIKEEFDREWELWKDQVQKETADETRNRKDNTLSGEGRTEVPSSEPRRGVTDWVPGRDR